MEKLEARKEVLSWVKHTLKWAVVPPDDQAIPSISIRNCGFRRSSCRTPPSPSKFN